MMQSARRRYDFAWRHRNLGGLIVLCLLAAAMLGLHGFTQHVSFSRAIPVNRSRVEIASEKINPNVATIASLKRLSGIGPLKARDIVTYREAQEPNTFRSADDLAKVPGIGPSLVERTAPHLALPRHSN